MKLEDLIIISVDDHITEPPTMFDNHLSRAQKERAPKLMTGADGSNYWVFEGRKIPSVGLNAVAGRVPEEFGMEPTSFSQLRKGCWDVHARIDDMNVNGIASSLNFGTFVRFDGSLFLEAEDKANALTMLKAYNDWHIGEWCGAYPARFIPLAILPLWDVNAMVDEVKRVHAKGCRAVAFNDNPSIIKLPSVHNAHWEPFWKVCNDLGVAICLHIGTGNAATHASMESPIDCWITTMPIAISVGAADWIHLKALQRYPNLRIALSEGGIGWVPYLLERIDFTHQQHKAWTHADFGKRKPSDIFREHFLTCFIDDQFGLANLDRIGEDIVSYECDYPHSDSLWPKAPEALHRSLTGLTDAQIDKVTHLNAMRFFSFDPFSKVEKDALRVGALRAKAKHVDITPKSHGGASPLAPGEKPRVVTSGDIVKMFAAHADAA